MQSLARVIALVGHFGADLVAEMRLQKRHDAAGVHHHLGGAFCVGRDAVNALRAQTVTGVADDLHGGEQSERDHGFHDVEFELAGRSSEHHGGVETDGEEAGLVRHFGDHGVDLARHDGGTGLQLRQIDFSQTATGTGSEQTHVIANLRELHRQALDSGGQGDVGTAVARGGDQVFAVLESKAGQFGELLDSQGRVIRVSRDACANGGGAEVHAKQVFLSFTDGLEFVIDGEAPAVEFLAERHRNSILQVGAAHLENALEFFSLLVVGGDEIFDRLHEHVAAQQESEVKSGRIGVVGGLTEVCVVVGAHTLVVALDGTEVFSSEVADHFVAVHVGGRTSTTLQPVSHELIVVLAFDELIAGPNESIGDISGDRAEFLVGQSGSLLDITESDNEERFLAHGHFRDVEVVLAADRLYAVVAIVGDLTVAKEVVFNTRHCCLLLKIVLNMKFNIGFRW